MKEYILALDQGTTGSRAVLFDTRGDVVSIAQREIHQFNPRLGWVEHDPEEIWASQWTVALEAVEKAGASARNIAAVGITNQRETTLIWDRKTGEPVCPAIVWQDRRTAAICETLRGAGHEALVRSRTGLVIDSYFSAPKIHWILNHIEGARERARRGELAFGTVDSWLLWKMTGGKVHVTDVTNASRTLLYNIDEQRWDESLLGLLDIPEELLPEVRSSSELYGSVSNGSLLDGVAIAGIAGDQQAALFGQGCTRSGMAKTTYGTGCFVLMNTGETPVMSDNNLLTTIAWKIGDQTQYALEGSVFSAGAVVRWLREGLGLIRSAREIEGLAAEVPDSGGLVLVPAFAGLGAPYWDSQMRGTMVGITGATTAAHLARAALDAIAFQTVDVLHAMEADSAIVLKELRVDGPGSRNNLLMQIQADLLQNRVARPKVAETKALGAAGLAALAVDFWEGGQEIGSRWEVDRKFEPRVSAKAAAAARLDWARALDQARPRATEEEEQSDPAELTGAQD
jgi:glycerol kinase